MTNGVKGRADECLPEKRLWWNGFSSLIWTAVIAATFLVARLVGEVAYVDFINHNPHRSQLNAAVTLILTPPFLVVVSWVYVAFCFGASLLFQSLLMLLLVRKYAQRGLLMSLIGVPMAALVTWYCYDYLISDFLKPGWNPDSEWPPPPHGLTGIRYLMALLVQTCVTMFVMLRLVLEMRNQPQSDKQVLIVSLALAFICGVVVGYGQARVAV
jgi:hypothetical protein